MSGVPVLVNERQRQLLGGGEDLDGLPAQYQERVAQFQKDMEAAEKGDINAMYRAFRNGAGYSDAEANIGDGPAVGQRDQTSVRYDA